MTGAEAPVALVTGAGRRLGRAFALRLAARGFAVVAHHRTASAEAAEVVAEIARRGGRATLVRADQRVESEVVDAVAAAAAAFGRIDVLVASAAVFPRDPEEGASADAFADVLRANVIGPYLFAREARRHLRLAGPGRAIFLGDVYGDRPLRGYATYSASKAALHSLVKSLARAWAPEIAVNAILPGVVLAPEDADPRTMDAVLRRTPTGRHGTPDDAAAALEFLASAPAQITGQLLAVDGGRTLL